MHHRDGTMLLISVLALLASVSVVTIHPEAGAAGADLPAVDATGTHLIVRVQDPRGAGIGNAQVVLQGGSEGPTVTVSTDGDGVAHLPLPEAGPWQLEVTGEGFAPRTASGDEDRAEVTLELSHPDGD